MIIVKGKRREDIFSTMGSIAIELPFSWEDVEKELVKEQSRDSDGILTFVTALDVFKSLFEEKPLPKKPQESCSCGRPDTLVFNATHCLRCGKPASKPEIKSNPQSMDAVVWAKEFMRIYNERPLKNTEWLDEDLMRGWFANAIMAGYDRGKFALGEKPEIERLRDERIIQFIKDLAGALRI